MSKFTARSAPSAAISALADAQIHPLLARIFAARGVSSSSELASDLACLLRTSQMHNLERAAALLADAIAARARLLIVADYDTDGATACAVGLRALRQFGAIVDYLVPNRFEYGYGLTPEITRLAKQSKNPDILITVDNGISSVEGVAAANALGMRVLITDHHLPGAELPDAWCIVNPNQRGCGFPSKHLAGVGVMFYLMVALRAELQNRGWFAPAGDLASGSTQRRAPNLAALLDLVALGTVADVVSLDDNNRILVQQGLQRMRSGKTWPGIAALMRVAGRDLRRISSYDLGFVLGPRLNAAGRLDDMSTGIECLITDDPAAADVLAFELDALNRERRVIETEMKDHAAAMLDQFSPEDNYTLCLFDPGWHQGVIGILASRLKDRWHRPVIAFARGAQGELKGSGRSIRSLHLRDALDLVAKGEPDLLSRFGGHAAAAGLVLEESQFPRFRAAFEAVVRSKLSPADLQLVIETDGALPPEQLTLDSARLIDQQVWGQGFPAPTFEAEFTTLAQHVVGEHHLKLRVAAAGSEYDAIIFSTTEPLPPRVHAVYRLAINEYQGLQKLQLTIEHWSPI